MLNNHIPQGNQRQYLIEIDVKSPRNLEGEDTQEMAFKKDALHHQFAIKTKDLLNPWLAKEYVKPFTECPTYLKPHPARKPTTRSR